MDPKEALKKLEEHIVQTHGEDYSLLDALVIIQNEINKAHAEIQRQIEFQIHSN